MAAITRRFGVVRDAGTSVTEEIQPQSFNESPLGVVAWAGILEKGPTDELIQCLGPSDFARRCGGRIEDGECPDNAHDFWSASRGAGMQYFVRVTDGTGRASSLTLKTREATGFGGGRWRDAILVEAKSVGRWGSAYNRRIGDISGGGDLSATTIDTGLTLLLDEFKGGTLVMTEMPTVAYTITGNTTAGVVTISSDSTLAADWTASGGGDLEFVLFKDNTNHLGETRKLAVSVKDGGRNPAEEFGLEVYWNGVKQLDYPDLSMDPNSDVYFESQINDDPSNKEIVVTDQFTGSESQTAYMRPANQSGIVDSVTSNTLTMETVQYYADSGNTGNSTIGSFVPGSSMIKGTITLTCTAAATPGPTAFSVSFDGDDKTHSAAGEGAAFIWPNEYGCDFTVTAGGTGTAIGDKFYIVLAPLVADEAIGGKLYPNVTDTPYLHYDIIDNDEVSVTVRPNFDLTTVTTASTKQYRVEFPEGMEKGYDGHAGVDSDDYIQVFDRTNSLFNQLKDKKLGLVKFAVPGVNTTSVQHAMRDYAQENAWMWRGEITKTITSEGDAIAYVNDTLLRNDFLNITFPSYYSKSDPDRTGYKTVCLTGLIQGLEAAFAYQFLGYHRVAAGTNAILPGVLEIPTGDVILNGEQLNPAGIQRVVKKNGQWVLWGARIPSSPTGIKWKHQREQLSHYIRVLLENFDWIMFTINDEDSDGDARAALEAFFLPEWKPKRAVRGKTFKDAVTIQIDSENNTNTTRAQGDKNCKIRYRPADTTERFNITLSPLTGVSETV